MNTQSNPPVIASTISVVQPKSRRGATTVEMAVVSIVLFGVIFGGLEVTRLASLRQSAEYASYIGARRGIISGATAAQVQEVTQKHLNDLGITGAEIIVSPSEIEETTQMVRVDVSVPIGPNSWSVPQFLTTSLNGRSTLLSERVAMVMSETLADEGTPSTEDEE